MKKWITMGLIVPLAMLVGFATVSMAADAPAKDELNQDLNKELTGESRGNVGSDGAEANELAPELGDDLGQDNSELNNSGSRESSSLAAKRGRQPRRGSTSKVVADQQQYWGDNDSGDDDSGPDEDEDPDMTETGN